MKGKHPASHRSGPRRTGPSAPKNELSELIRFRGRPKQHYVPWPSTHHSRPSPYPTATHNQQQQQANVKTHYKPTQKLAAHYQYLGRDGKGMNGEPPRYFTRQGEEPEIDPQPIPGEPRFFSVILSPENGDQLDMESYTREFVARLEKDRADIQKGNDTAGHLRWAAAIHYNTEHPHAHIVIRGLDTKDNEVIFSREQIQEGMRKHARDIATRELGPRSINDIERSKSLQIEAERFTQLDRIIGQFVTPESPELKTNDPAIERRLHYLSQISEAERISNGQYRMKPDWDRHLRAKGEKADILKTLYSDMKQRSPDHQRTYQYNNAWTIEGTVIHKGHDEKKDQDYALVQQGTRHYYYNGAHADDLSVGDRIRLDKGQATVFERRAQHEQPGPELSRQPPAASPRAATHNKEDQQEHTR